MAGNVYQWTSSCNEDACATRVVRGGSWFESFVELANVAWSAEPPYMRSTDLGFRLVREL